MGQQGIKVPVGPARGKLITECSVAELEDACTRVEEKLCAATSATSIARHKRFVGAARPLLKLRKFPTGSFDTTESANLALRDAAEMGHLLAPSPQMAGLLPGCALLITAFRVDQRHDVFPDDEKEGLFIPAKPMLDRIWRDLGVSWRHTRRTDSGRDAYVRSYEAEGAVRNFDASERLIQGNAGLDLGQNSPRVVRLRTKNIRRERGDFDIERQRELIDSSCDTQARLKACRQLGVQPAYAAKDLAKPFFVAKLQFTGKTDDPALKQLMGQHVVDSFKSSSAALFGRRVG